MTTIHLVRTEDYAEWVEANRNTALKLPNIERIRWLLGKLPEKVLIGVSNIALIPPKEGRLVIFDAAKNTLLVAPSVDPNLTLRAIGHVLGHIVENYLTGAESGFIDRFREARNIEDSMLGEMDEFEDFASSFSLFLLNSKALSAGNRLRFKLLEEAYDYLWRDGEQ